MIVEVCQQMQNQMDLSAGDSSKNVQWSYGTKWLADIVILGSSVGSAKMGIKSL